MSDQLERVQGHRRLKEKRRLKGKNHMEGWKWGTLLNIYPGPYSESLVPRSNPGWPPEPSDQAALQAYQHFAS